MLRRVTPLICTGLLTLLWVSIASQLPVREIFFDRYGPEQGLHSRQVRDIVQSSDGFIWMATNEGLVRYDGKDFVLFYDSEVPTHLSTNRYIETMVIDDRDQVWMANNEQVSVYSIPTGTWNYLIDSTGSSAIFGLDFSYDPKRQRMWISGSRGLCFADEKLNVHPFHFRETKYASSPYNTMTFQHDTAIWLGNTYGYYRLNPATGTVAEYHLSNPSQARVGATGISNSFLQGDSILWLGGWESGLIRHDLKSGIASRYFYTDPLKEMNTIYSVVQTDIQGQSHWLWVGTFKGLMAFDTRTGTFTSYHSQDAFNSSGVTGAVFSFFYDADKALWIGSGDGLFRFDQRKQGIDKIDLPQFDLCFPLDNIAFEKRQNGTERLWLTIPYCGWHIYDLKTRTIEDVPASFQREIQDVGIFDIYIDRMDRLWISTNERGLLVFDLRRQQFESYSGKYFKENGKWVSEILESASGQMWLGTYDGLYRFDERLQQCIEISPVRKLIDAKSITSSIYNLAEDQQGNIWATTHFDDERSSSLMYYDAVADVVTHYDRYVTADFKSIHEFRDVVCTRDGTLMVTTDRGLLAIAKGDINNLKDFPELNANLGTSVYSLTIDGDDGVWISTAFGVARFNPANNTIFTYDYTNSLLRPGRIPGIWYDNISDRVYVAQKGGFDVISPELPATRAVRLHCLGVFVNQVRTDTISQSLSSLRYDQNDFEVHLALPAFTNAQNNLFRYMLDGYEDEWTTSSDGKIIYNNLPPGTYTFRAVGITSEGLQSSNTIAIPLHIYPPFWRTIWFQLGMLAIISGVILAFFLYRDRQRRRLQQMRDAIARDLHDDMGSNLSTIKLLSEFELMKHPAEKQQTLRTILEKTNLVMESMYEIIWSINPAKGQATDIISKITGYIIQVLEPLNIDIHFELSGDLSEKDWRLTIDQRRQLFLICKEAVNNIAKYANATHVTFSLQKEKGYVILTIKDNGIGFDPNTIVSGNGLLNMKVRAQALHGEVVVDSRHGEGTRVKVRLPHRT
jgi:signal transduction histidine kinase/ligand-binding sensor domain-containing protein